MGRGAESTACTAYEGATIAMRPAHAIRYVLLTLVAALLLSGCAQGFVQDLSELFPLRDQLIQTYHEDNMNVVIQNGSALGISFINSAFNDLPTQEAKQAKAREIAQFAKDRYSRIDHIDTIWVSFTIHKEYFLVFNYSNSVDTFFFKTADLDHTDHPAP
jgi:hypothetical protein